MKDDLDWHTYKDQPEVTQAGNRGTSSPPLGAKRELHGLADFFAGLQGRSWVAFARRHLVLMVFLGMLACAMAGIIFGYITRPAPGTATQTADAQSGSPSDSASGEKKSKRAPGKPLMAETQAPPPVLTHPTPPPAIEPQAPAGMVPVPPRSLNPSPSAPTSAPSSPPALPTPGVVPQPYAPVVYPARHDKVFGEGCSGQLTLDNNGLAFRCFDGGGDSVQVALADIEAVDSNGVRLISGKKYHFSIAGMGKSNVEALFANWLQRVR